VWVVLAPTFHRSSEFQTIPIDFEFIGSIQLINSSVSKMSASITSSSSGDFDMSYDVDSLLDFDFDFSEISEDDVSLALSEGLLLLSRLAARRKFTLLIFIPVYR